MNIRGQSLIELAMILPILIAFWVSIVWFAQVFIVSIELMHTARHGVFWLAYNEDPHMSPDEEIQRVRNECAAFLNQQAPSIDMRKVTVTVLPGDRWQPVGPKNLMDVMGLINLATHFTRFVKNAVGLINFQPASVKVEYDLAAPPLLRALPGFPQTIPLRGYCVCYR